MTAHNESMTRDRQGLTRIAKKLKPTAAGVSLDTRDQLETCLHAAVYKRACQYDQAEHRLAERRLNASIITRPPPSIKCILAVELRSISINRSLAKGDGVREGLNSSCEMVVDARIVATEARLMALCDFSHT
jgi:hypothetical protein